MPVSNSKPTHIEYGSKFFFSHYFQQDLLLFHHCIVYSRQCRSLQNSLLFLRHISVSLYPFLRLSLRQELSSSTHFKPYPIRFSHLKESFFKIWPLLLGFIVHLVQQVWVRYSPSCNFYKHADRFMTNATSFDWADFMETGVIYSCIFCCTFNLK